MTPAATDVPAAPAPAQPRVPAPALVLLLLAALVAGMTWVSVSLTRIDGGVSALWTANGLLVGVLLLRPRELWGWWFLAAGVGQLGARLLINDHDAIAVALTAINLAESWAVAYWVRRGSANLREFDSLAAVSRAALVSSIVACALSGVAAVLVARAATPPLVTWITWFSAHLLGMAVVATLTTLAFQPHVRLLGRAGRRVDYGLCVAFLLVVCVGIQWQQRFPLLFLGYLPLLLLTFRHGLAGMVVGVLVLAVSSGLALALDRGPFVLVEGESALARLLLWQVYVACACLIAYPTAVTMAERRQLMARMRASEARYRLLTDFSQDMIVRRGPDRRPAYISPASRTLLGYAPEELLRPEARAILHPDDAPGFDAAIARLYETGQPETFRFRLCHRDGHYVWLEAAARSVDTAAGREVIYSSRDISQRVAAEQERAAVQAQLEAITEHLPALVARFDREGRYLYANARSQALVPGVDLIGKSLRELRGDTMYATFSEHVEGVLRGVPQSFDTFVPLPGRPIELHAQFVPDRAADGSVQGFYSLSFDITAAKDAERQLEKLARSDALTGLANRHLFDERLADAVIHAQRNGTALMLMSLDLDRFKGINDTFGHAVGDAVLQEFATRLRRTVYDVDLVARLGGDEFVVLVDYTPRQDVAGLIAQRILDAVRPPMQLGPHVLQAGTSIGIGLHHPVVSAARLLALADEALYAAKARGRNCWELRAG